MKFKLVAPLIVFVVFAAAPWNPALAQKWEINPYAGGIFPTEFADRESFKNEGIYGVRGGRYGLFGLDNLLVEGNFGYINHFEFQGTDPESSAFIWEANGSWHFFSENSRITPFVTAGVGGVTLSLDGVDSVSFRPDGKTVTEIAANQPSAGTTFRFEDSDSFFAFNYGGGVKANRLWGPVGLRFDVRGRTLPNAFGGRALNWVETTGGLTISWGE